MIYCIIEGLEFILLQTFFHSLTGNISSGFFQKGFQHHYDRVYCSLSVSMAQSFLSLTLTLC